MTMKKGLMANMQGHVDSERERLEQRLFSHIDKTSADTTHLLVRETRWIPFYLINFKSVDSCLSFMLSDFFA